MLLAFLIIYNPAHPVRKFSFPQWLCVLILSLIAVRFLLFPDISDRFYIAYYFVIAILFIKKFIPKQNKENSIHVPA
jgi:hypothetical protein